MRTLFIQTNSKIVFRCRETHKKTNRKWLHKALSLCTKWFIVESDLIWFWLKCSLYIFNCYSTLISKFTWRISVWDMRLYLCWFLHAQDNHRLQIKKETKERLIQFGHWFVSHKELQSPLQTVLYLRKIIALVETNERQCIEKCALSQGRRLWACISWIYFSFISFVVKSVYGALWIAKSVRIFFYKYDTHA